MKKYIPSLLLSLLLAAPSVYAQNENDAVVVPDNTRFGRRFIPERRSDDRTSASNGAGAFWFNTREKMWKGDKGDGVIYSFAQGGSGGGSGPQSPNTVNAGPPSGSSANPSFRALVPADIPGLDASKITTGTIPVARIPALNTIPSGLTGSRCVETTAGGLLTVAAAPCGTGGGGGSSAFSAITGGTNTSAAMIVGTGASMSATGTGTIAATSLTTNLPVSRLNSGTGATASTFWRGDGTWAAISGVTSVNASVPAFLAVSGVPITGAGTIAITLSGQALPITSGGTGAITASQARINLGISSTTGSSILKGNGAGGFANAVSGIDYAPATAGSSILKASAGGFANAVSGTDYELPLTFSSPLSRTGNTISCPTCGTGGGGVTTSGTITPNMVAFFSGPTTITGHSGFTFNPITGQLTLPTSGGFSINYTHDTLTANRTFTAPNSDSIAISTTGLAAVSNQFVTGIDSGSKTLLRSAIGFSNLTGTVTDAQVPDLNALSTGLTANRCVRTNTTGGLAVAASDCGVGGGGGTPGGSINTMQVNNAGAFDGYDELRAYQTTQDTSSDGPRIIIQPFDSITTDRTMTVPVGGNSTAVRPTACTGGQRISAINADGSVTCS